jgi:diguanylate cyclase (GGDEF)-like protein
MQDILNSKYKRNFLAIIFFFINSILIYKYNAISAYLYPIFVLSLILLKENDYEAKFIIIFGSFIWTASLIYISHIFTVHLINFIFLCASAYLFHRANSEIRKEKELIESKISMSLVKLKNLENDIDSYKKHLTQLKNRLSINQILMSTFKNIQQNSIEATLSEVYNSLKKIFDDCELIIKSDIHNDYLAAYVYQTKIPVLIKNSKEDSRFKNDIFSENERSLIALPISSFNIPIGIVKVISQKEERFSQRDLNISELIATTASISIENLSLFAKINELAMKDALTSLFTHRVFQDKLDMEILTSARTKIPFSLIIADIDHFKKYNDTYGHQAGDEVLKKTAMLFSSMAREIDTVARYGGEEFAFILPGYNLTESYKFAENIRQNLSRLTFNFNGITTTVTASFGISEFPKDALIKSQLIRLADERLYKAKKSGRNRVVYE